VRELSLKLKTIKVRLVKSTDCTGCRFNSKITCTHPDREQTECSHGYIYKQVVPWEDGIWLKKRGEK